MIKPERLATCIKLRETLLFAYSQVQIGVAELQSDGIEMPDEAIDSLNSLYGQLYMGSVFQQFVSQAIRDIDLTGLPEDEQRKYEDMLNDHMAALQEDVRKRDALIGEPATVATT